MRSVLLLLTGSVTLAASSSAQESKAILDAPLVVVGPQLRLDHLLDLNGDGRMDFVALSQTASQINLSLFLNDGLGGFANTSYGLGAQADYPKISYVETCDANLDGRDDLVWVVKSAPGSPIAAGFMRVATWGPSGVSLVDHLEYQDISATIVLGTVLDADLDGDADRVRITHNYFDGDFLCLDLFEQDASGAWSYTTQSMELPFLPQTLLRMDYDGDAYTDLYLHNGAGGTFVPLAGGTLHTPVTFLHGISLPMPKVIPGDVDGDHDQDLVIFDMTGYALCRRTGPASWTIEPRRPGGPGAKLADVDGDGDLDGICCGGGSNAYDTWGEPSTFRIALNDGTGNFAPAFEFPGLGSRIIAGAADLDGDGDVDLCAGQCIYFAHGPLTHAPQRALAQPQSTRSLVDFDGDGDADFTPGLGTFARHLGNGSTCAFTLLRPAAPAGMTDEGPGLPGDWDGDGDVDLIVRRKLGTTFQEMHLFVNEGGGSYADGGTASATDFLPGLADVQPDSSFAVDLDLDGDLDLATFRRAPVNTDSWTKTWLNDGAGRFTFAWQRNAAWPLGFAPVHGTSAPDALLVRYLHAADRRAVAYLHAGLGNGAFDNAYVLDLPLGEDLGPASVALADFDRDGDVDLAGAFEFGGDDSRYGKGWYLPNIGGSLSMAAKVLLDELAYQSMESPARPIARIAHAVDVDADGLLDVVLSSPEFRRPAISIVRRASDNQGWLQPVRQVVYPFDPADETNARALTGAWLDLDGDGDSEYVTDAIWNNVRRGPREWGTRRQDTGGSADAAGRIPTLGATGPFRPGRQMVVRLTGVPSGALGVLSVAGAQPGSKARPLPERFFPEATVATYGPATPGAGRWEIALPIPVSFAALVHRLRVELVDPTDQGRILRSNVLELSFGR